MMMMMKTRRLLLLLVWATVAPAAAARNKPLELPNSKYTSGNSGGLCVIGCTPYVDFDDPIIEKYKALINDMAKSCDVIAHVGDIKPPKMPCNHLSATTRALTWLVTAAKQENTTLLYTPGESEIANCHQHASTGIASQVIKAVDARTALVNQFKLRRTNWDLTLQHRMTKAHNEIKQKGVYGTTIPGTTTNKKYHCVFDRYFEKKHYAIATLEVPGAYWYLKDERVSYSKQNQVDPLAGRLALFLNARACALDWIVETARLASQSKKLALVWLFHGAFTVNGGQALQNDAAIGDYYKSNRLKQATKNMTGVPKNGIDYPYKDLFDTLTKVAKQYPDLTFYVIHADAHRFESLRANGFVENTDKETKSNHNLYIHTVEGTSRALTTFARLTIDPNSFHPVTIKEEWSLAAYNQKPVGHTWQRYIAPRNKN